MATSDIDHTASVEGAPRTVEIAYLPSAYRRRGADPLRAIAFFNGRHPYDAHAVAPQADVQARALREAMRAERIGALAQLVPQLKSLAHDPRPSVRATFATCFSILARAGQAPTDREIWRSLLGLSKYDEDPEVRAAADRALADFEHCGTVAQAS